MNVYVGAVECIFEIIIKVCWGLAYSKLGMASALISVILVRELVERQLGTSWCRVGVARRSPLYSSGFRTHLSSHAHPYSVQTPDAEVNMCLYSCSLPVESLSCVYFLLPLTYNPSRVAHTFYHHSSFKLTMICGLFFSPFSSAFYPLLWKKKEKNKMQEGAS